MLITFIFGSMSYSSVNASSKISVGEKILLREGTFPIFCEDINLTNGIFPNNSIKIVQENKSFRIYFINKGLINVGGQVSTTYYSSGNYVLEYLKTYPEGVIEYSIKISDKIKYYLKTDFENYELYTNKGGMRVIKVRYGYKIDVTAIYNAWKAYEYAKSDLGYPISDKKQTKTKDGYYYQFSGGYIFCKNSKNAKGYVVSGDIYKKWDETGRESGFLGYPITDGMLSENNGGYYQYFERGSIFKNRRATDDKAYEVHGMIENSYKEHGYENGFLGYPVTDELDTADKKGRYNEFQHGSIYYKHGADGAYAIGEKFLEKWLSAGGENSIYGFPVSNERWLSQNKGKMMDFEKSNAGFCWKVGTDNIYVISGKIKDKWLSLNAEQGPLGYPISDKLYSGNPYGTYGDYTKFEGGRIYVVNNSANDVHGEIYDKYISLGGHLRSFGFPISGEKTTSDGKGKYNNFEKGTIYHKDGVGAFEVHGKIKELLDQYGVDESNYGFPTSDTIKLTYEDKKNGFYSKFENGRIYYKSGDTSAYGIMGPIFQKFDELGAESSFLGYPLTGIIPLEGYKAKYVQFEGGIIVLKNGSDKAYVMYGKVLNKWKKADSSTFGLPIRDCEESSTKNFIGCKFEKGGIYYFKDLGIYRTISGKIGERWANASTKHPISDEISVFGGSYQDFDGRTYVYNPDKNEVFILQKEALIDYWKEHGNSVGLPVECDQIHGSGNAKIECQYKTLYYLVTTGKVYDYDPNTPTPTPTPSNPPSSNKPDLTVKTTERYDYGQYHLVIEVKNEGNTVASNPWIKISYTLPSMYKDEFQIWEELSPGETYYIDRWANSFMGSVEIDSKKTISESNEWNNSSSF